MKIFFTAVIFIVIFIFTSCETKTPGTCITLEVDKESIPVTSENTAETSYSSEAISAARSVAQYLNENSNLDFLLLTPWDETMDIGLFENIGGYGCRILSNEANATSYVFAGFPDALDGFALIGFRTTEKKYRICGVSCGMSSQDAEKSLIDHGFIKTGELTYSLSFGHDGWFISAYLNNGAVNKGAVNKGAVIELSVYFINTNIQGVDF